MEHNKDDMTQEEIEQIALEALTGEPEAKEGEKESEDE